MKQFLKDFNSYAQISDWLICDLLEVACDELPDRVTVDPLKARIYWYVAARLDRLKKFSRFADILCDWASLGRDLCLQAGNSTMSQPHRPPDPAPVRFKEGGTAI